MKNKILVWIFEDKQRKLEDAEKVVKDCAGSSAVIIGTNQLCWPPAWGLDELPQLVILDLFKQHDDPAGLMIYRNLREEERKKDISPSMVIVWTAYMADAKVEIDIAEHFESDVRLMKTDIKTRLQLREYVAGALRRIEEEP